MSLDTYVRALGPLPPLLTVVGLGDGALLDALARSGWRGRVVAFEPRTGLRAARLEHPTYRAWTTDGRLQVIEGPEYYGGVDACLAVSGVELKALAEPGFATRFPDDTRVALNAMLRAVRSVRANSASRQRHAGVYRENTLRNAAALAREGDITALVGAAPGVPAIIVAAGPSLDAQLDALRAAQDRALIICVDTALRPLTAAGIAPHLCVAVDPTATNANHLVDVSGAESTWLVAEGSVDPHAIAAFAGRIFACRIARHDPWPRLESRGFSVGTLRAWGSVLTSAMDLALHVGAKEIAFAGADLSFPGGRPYCRGTTFEQAWRRIADWGTPLDQQWQANLDGWSIAQEPNTLGQPERTAPHLIAFRDWIRERAAALRGVRVTNASPAGILHGPEIEQAPLASLLERWPPLDMRGRIAARWQPRPELARALTELAPFEPSRTGVITPSHDAPPVTTWRQPDPVTMPLVRLTIPRARVHRHAGGWFTFTFRTRAGRRWMAQRYAGEPRLFEDDRQLTARDTIDATAPAGSFAMTLDEIGFKPFGNADPRFDGPPFVLELPDDIANYESLPLDLVLQHGL